MSQNGEGYVCVGGGVWVYDPVICGQTQTSSNGMLRRFRIYIYIYIYIYISRKV